MIVLVFLFDAVPVDFGHGLCRDNIVGDQSVGIGLLLDLLADVNSLCILLEVPVLAAVDILAEHRGFDVALD